MSMARDKIKDELEEVRRRHGGVLKASDVVHFASNPKTALHAKFTWDNDIAGAKYRLWQARQLIRVSVVMLEQATVETRAFVSLYADRNNAGGGYRAMVDVLSDAEKRDQLLGQALSELKSWQAKYRELKALAPVFSAIEEVEHLEAVPA